MANNVKIGIIARFSLIREALKSLLAKHPAYQVIGEAHHGLKTIDLAESWKVDLIIVDLMPMPNDLSNLTMVTELKRRMPQIPVLAISTDSNVKHILDLFKTGANGFCQHSDSFTEILSAIENLLTGRYYLNPQAMDNIVRKLLAEHRNHPRLQNGVLSTLSERENEILALVKQGHRSKEIARYLNLSIRTVEKHRYNIIKKLNIRRLSAVVPLISESFPMPGHRIGSRTRPEP